jgi:N-acetyl-1-D-myo-inositol-2-amino-2-deoxy-alpha-D-glucopyranoside deacetylase
MRGLALRAVRALRLPALALATVAIGYLAWIGADGTLAGFRGPTLPSADTTALGDRVLVLSPHPDDETLAAGGLVRESLLAHRHVMVVVVTCGDGFKRIVRAYASPTSTVPAYVRLGEVRAAETRRATQSLGLPSADLTFLGYPDGSLAPLWSGDWDPADPHTGKNGETKVPYDFALRPGAAYAGSSVASDLASILTSFAPTAVVYPDANDANPDHWAVNAFTEFALDLARFRGARYTYLVHRGHFPFPWSYVPQAWLRPPRTLQGIGTTWLSYALSAETENAKEQAVFAYSSQRKAMEPFLASFVRRNELFATSRETTWTSIGDTRSLDASVMPGVAVHDPAADTLMRAVDGGGDIREVAIVRAPDGVWLGLRTQGTIAPGMAYRICGRLLHDDGTTARVDVEVRRGKSSSLQLGSDDVLGSGALPSRVKGGRIWIRTPASLFAGTRECMLAAESYQGGTVLDRTAWRSVALR